MKETKQKFEHFNFYDFSAIQNHLEGMAAEGWMVEKLGNCFWRYRHIQPQCLHFAVTYFPNASELDPVPTAGQQQMEEYSTKQGWVLAARWGQMQIFYNEAEQPVPMETDAVTQIETIHRAMKKSILPTHFLLIALCIYQLIFMGVQFYSNPVSFLSKPTSLYMVIAWILILLPAVLEIFFYLNWYHKAKELAGSGILLEIKSHSMMKRGLLAISMLLVAAAVISSLSGMWVSLGWGCFIIALGFFLRLLRDWLKRHGASRTTNRVILIVVSIALSFTAMGGLVYSILHFDLYKDGRAIGTYDMGGWVMDVYDDELPLQVEDLLNVSNIEWSRQSQKSETVLVASTEYTQYPLSNDKTIPDLNYTVTEVKLPILYNLCKDGLMAAKRDERLEDGTVFTDHYEAIEAAPWGAIAAYQQLWSDSVLNNYLLFYDNQIVELCLTWEPTPEQMSIVAEKLAK